MTPPTGEIHLIGPLRARNTLIASFFQEHLGIVCVSHERSYIGQPCKPKGSYPLLILWDFLGKDMNALDGWHCLPTRFPTDPVLIALFNAHPSKDIEKKAVDRGIRGVFFTYDHPALVARGVQAILRGELWYSRETLDACVLRKMLAAGRPAEKHAHLTHREKEILMMLISGAAYAEIAKAFFISARTVKSHVYKIYRKIGVSNRFQAARWAFQHV